MFENNCPWGGVLARFFCPIGRGFALSFCPGMGIRPFKKFPWGWSGLEFTDTLRPVETPNTGIPDGRPFL